MPEPLALNAKPAIRRDRRGQFATPPTFKAALHLKSMTVKASLPFRSAPKPAVKGFQVASLRRSNPRFHEAETHRKTDNGGRDMCL